LKYAPHRNIISNGYVYPKTVFMIIEVLSMIISYNKLWKLLIDKKMSKADLRKAISMFPNTLTKMRRDEEVSMSVLLKIAE
jgi:DNA-binding Xre family transcriptional regulator